MDPGTDLEDERLTPFGSPSSAVDESVPLSTTLGLDLELARAFLEVGVLPAMVTPIVDPEVGSSMTPATYPVPPIPMLLLMDSVPLEVASPASPAGGEFCSERVFVVPGIVSWFRSTGLSVSIFAVVAAAADVSPPSDLAAMDQDSPWSASLPVGESTNSPLLSAHLAPRRMVKGKVVPGSVVPSPPEDTNVVGGHPRMPDLSLEGPFDVHQDRSASGTSPRVLDGVRGCQYRMTSYDEESGGPDFSLAYGIQLHDLRLLEYVGGRSRLDYSAVVWSIGCIT